MKTIIASLDSIASRLQSNGLDKLAELVDTVTNTLETKDPTESSYYRESYDVLRQWVTTLKNSVLGSPVGHPQNTVITKLNILVGRSVLTKEALEASHEWQQFLVWLMGQAKTGAVIPQSYFYHDTKPHKWETLAKMIDVLDQRGSDKPIDKYLAEHEPVKEIANTWKSPARLKAEELFKKPEMARLANTILTGELSEVNTLITHLQQGRAAA